MRKNNKKSKVQQTKKSKQTKQIKKSSMRKGERPSAKSSKSRKVKSKDLPVISIPDVEPDDFHADLEAIAIVDEIPAIVDLDTDGQTADHLEEIKESKEKKQQIKTIFDVNEIEDGLVGTPKEVREELDQLALHMQKHPRDNEAFLKIRAYIHKYLLGLVFKKFKYINGNDHTDIYQETLIAISKKAIPGFNPNKGMSFLNFAKMCITRHLITILHASKHRRKDMPMNKAISLDQCPIENEDGNCSLSNVITDEKHSAPPYKELLSNESFTKTLTELKKRLSPLEILVLEEYLKDLSYDEIARNVTKMGMKCDSKTADNSLYRVRLKSARLLKELGEDGAPIMF